MPSPSKNKGSSFEREVAQFLTKTYSESFIRAPGSGAYVGGKNQSRKEFLHEGQIRSFKGDIVPGETFKHFNAECKNYGEFPFHLLPTGECKVLNSWLDQLLAVADEKDCNILFMKITRKGKYVAVESKYTWVADNFIHYRSESSGEWIIMDFDHFFRLNKDLLKAYSGSNSQNNSNHILTINT